MSAESKALRRRIDEHGQPHRERETHRDFDSMQVGVQAEERVELKRYVREGSEGSEHSDSMEGPFTPVPDAKVDFEDQAIGRPTPLGVALRLKDEAEAKNAALLKEYDKLKQTAMDTEIRLGGLIQIEKEKVRMLSQNVHPSTPSKPLDEIWVRAYEESIRMGRKPSESRLDADQVLAAVRGLRSDKARDNHHAAEAG